MNTQEMIKHLQLEIMKAKLDMLKTHQSTFNYATWIGFVFGCVGILLSNESTVDLVGGISVSITCIFGIISIIYFAQYKMMEVKVEEFKKKLK
jgi:hypothetical protein